MERLGTLPFVAQPGEAWVYGYNTDILGCVVEKAHRACRSTSSSARASPARSGMKDTQFFLPPAQRERLAAVYASGSDGTIVRAPDGARGQGAYVDGPRKSFAGGAGLLSTARDYARFLEMIRSGGALDGVRILSPRTVALMTTNQVGTLHSHDRARLRPRLRDDRSLRRQRDGARSARSGGAGAYGSNVRVDPEARLVIVFMMQIDARTRTDLGTQVPDARVSGAGRRGGAREPPWRETLKNW